MFLLNHQSIADKIQAGSVRQLLILEDQQLAVRLYLRFLGRQPSAKELAAGIKHLSQTGDREVAFDDLVWALVNCREFVTNH